MLDLKDAVAVVETLELADQTALRLLLSESLYKKLPVHKIKRGESFDALTASGLAVCIDDPAGVALSPDLQKVRRSLCTYLVRRNEVETYLDENMDEHEIPKGAEFSCSVSVGGRPAVSGLSLSFPDDEITELLNRYGANRCRGWKI